MIKIKNNRDIRENGSGCYDPTAFNVIQKINSDAATVRKREAEAERFNKLLDAIFKICELSGFHIEERIVIKDTKTGKVWR